MRLFKHLLNLFKPLRCFALVDQQGICRALRQATEAPQGSGWVEIDEYRLSLLSRPLPAKARLRGITCKHKQQPQLAT
jgi:hypothetical protein